MFQMFHLFQTYIAFKCFMLHVFHVVRRVRGRGRVMVAWHGHWGMGRGEPVAGGRDAHRARAGGRGYDGRGAPTGQGERMGAD